ncbi:MAG: hypothetical protein ACW981_05605, partial [Candidatus Hodarchaeales archaeon]
MNTFHFLLFFLFTIKITTPDKARSKLKLFVLAVESVFVVFLSTLVEIGVMEAVSVVVVAIIIS